jgi:hypothetical protein
MRNNYHKDKKVHRRYKVNSYLLRWAGYDESCDTLEPWKHVNYNYKLHEFLRAKKMAKFIPKDKQNEYTGAMRNK